MSKIFRKFVTLTLLIVLFVTCLIFLLTSFNIPQLFLSKTNKVKANLLVVEGWLPPYALDMVCKEFYDNNYDLIITTGIKYSAYDFVMVASNGYLIFYPCLEPDLRNDYGYHTIEVEAFSEMNGFYSPHFNFFINDSLVADFNAVKRKRMYGIKWKGYLKDIDSLMIQFDNDLRDVNGDRNLFVKKIIIDKKIIIPYQFNSELDIGPLDGKERLTKYTYFDSSAEFCRNYLITCGIDSGLIIAVPGKKVYINRTHSSVLTIRNWLRSTDINVTGINIISLGIHSRRTWINYRKVLGKNIEIGIISLPENENHESIFRDAFKIIDEILGIIYYHIILTFIDI
jgi:hypothetical protein